MSAICPRCGAEYPPGRFGLCPSCLLLAEIPPARVGDSLELIEEIGRGGMGAVYKARHLRLGRTVAVKFLAEGLAEQPEFEKRFEREAQALALLQHPGIVAVHDFGRDGGRSYIVMEYVEGRPLSEVLPLGAERALDVALQACAALAYAHARGVVHRDVKPENILLDASGRAKISDFGIARLLHREGDEWTVTTAGRVVGTPHYLAPEALAGAPPDPRMDVYSLGVVLYEMLTGRRPVGDFEALSPHLDRIVRKALAPDPARRYASIEEMRRDLARAAAPRPEELPPDERNWLRAVALLQTLATAVALWAFLLSVTPKVLGPGDVQPLIMLGAEALADGRIVSRARFETWPTLAAVGTLVVALAAYGLLRRHWRETGLDAAQPETPVRESWWVFGCGAIAMAVYGLRQLLERGGHAWVSPYVPIVGGLIELASLVCLWIAILQAWRTSRSVARETPLWAGMALALYPPALDLTAYLWAWRP